MGSEMCIRDSRWKDPCYFFGHAAASSSCRIVICLSVKPLAIAGVVPIVECLRHQLYHEKKIDCMAVWCSRLLLNAFVSRVKRRSDMRIVKFIRSTCDVQIRSSAGEPKRGTFSEAIIVAGEYRVSVCEAAYFLISWPKSMFEPRANGTPY